MGDAVLNNLSVEDTDNKSVNTAAPIKDTEIPVAGSKRIVNNKETSAELYFAPNAADLKKFLQVKRALIHYTSIDPLGEFTAAEIEILDDRIQRTSLEAVVIALVARANGAPLRAMFSTLGGKPMLSSYQVENIREPATHCICAEVAGSEVTIGDEEFLLERGVIVDSLDYTLVSNDQPGFYLLVAVGDAIIARCLITPPRFGDGRALVAALKKEGISVEVVSFGASMEAHQCASEIGLTGEDVREIESALHLDALLDRPDPFLLLTSDLDCAEYVSRKGLVAFFSDTKKFNEDTKNVFQFSSFDLRHVARLFNQAKQNKLRLRFKLFISAVVVIAIAVAGFFLNMYVNKSS
jgi:hypothetical protein